MLSIREQRFLNRLQEKYRKKIFEFVKEGETQTITVDGRALSLAWMPHLDELSDSAGDMVEVLFDDCVAAIKESMAAEKKHKREAKKAYLKQNK
jgi:hypothetical protein